jgi:ketosteroid isomerase-like protein
MSQENVELVLRMHKAFNEGDLEGVLSGWHPDAEYRDAVHQAVEGEAGVFIGHDGIRRWWRDLQDHYDDLSTEVLDVRDLGERLFVLFVVSGRGKGSGLALDAPVAQVVTMRDGKMIAARDYFDHRQALKAVGLEE